MNIVYKNIIDKCWLSKIDYESVTWKCHYCIWNNAKVLNIVFLYLFRQHPLAVNFKYFTIPPLCFIFDFFLHPAYPFTWKSLGTRVLCGCIIQPTPLHENLWLYYNLLVSGYSVVVLQWDSNRSANTFSSLVEVVSMAIMTICRPVLWGYIWTFWYVIYSGLIETWRICKWPNTISSYIKVLKLVKHYEHTSTPLFVFFHALVHYYVQLNDIKIKRK